MSNEYRLKITWQLACEFIKICLVNIYIYKYNKGKKIKINHKYFVLDVIYLKARREKARSHSTINYRKMIFYNINLY